MQNQQQYGLLQLPRMNGLNVPCHTFLGLLGICGTCDILLNRWPVRKTQELICSVRRIGLVASKHSPKHYVEY